MITILECTAEECAYNKSQCCCRDDVSVAGSAASTTKETCCDSFHKKGAGGAVNTCSCSTPKRSVEINCDARGCVYNNDSKCFADRIGISGAGVTDGTKTQCATFRPRD